MCILYYNSLASYTFCTMSLSSFTCSLDSLQKEAVNFVRSFGKSNGLYLLWNKSWKLDMKSRKWQKSDQLIILINGLTTTRPMRDGGNTRLVLSWYCTYMRTPSKYKVGWWHQRIRRYTMEIYISDSFRLYWNTASILIG